MAKKRPKAWLLAGGAATAVAVAGLVLFGRSLLGMAARRIAGHYMSRWALSTAERWLDRAAWLLPDDARVDLMRAACLRRWGRIDRWRQVMEEAKRKGAPAEKLELESRLASIRSGQAVLQAERYLVALLDAGVPQQDVLMAFVEGYLAIGEFNKAKTLLEGYQREFPDDPHLAYLWGIYWLQLQEPIAALEQLRKAVAIEPKHELAQITLAALLEGGHRPEEALRQHMEAVRQAPHSVSARVGLARTLRKLGCLDEARRVLRPLASRPDPLPEVAIEMGQLELLEGDYQRAVQWFDCADLEHHKDYNKLSVAAVAFALTGQPDRAEQLLARQDAAIHRSRRSHDLRTRLVADPNDRQAAMALQQLIREEQAAISGQSADARQADSNRPEPPDQAVRLYRRHCAACHGQNGAGDGPAARHLWPRPRDFRSEKFHLVRSRNGAPTSEDIQEVTRAGMPGTSMPAFDQLHAEQLKMVAEVVLQLHREGLREQLARSWEEQGEVPDPEELEETIELLAEPGELVEPPPIGPPEGQSVARGRQLYFELGCDKCHGPDGRGAADAFEFDEKGRPSRPRDLVYEPFKGGDDPQSLYLRVLLGMPGTPHPATWNLSEDQVVDLVQFCRSLSRPQKLELTNHQQATLCHSRDYLQAFPGKPPRAIATARTAGIPSH